MFDCKARRSHKITVGDGALPGGVAPDPMPDDRSRILHRLRTQIRPASLPGIGATSNSSVYIDAAAPLARGGRVPPAFALCATFRHSLDGYEAWQQGWLKAQLLATARTRSPICA